MYEGNLLEKIENAMNTVVLDPIVKSEEVELEPRSNNLDMDQRDVIFHTMVSVIKLKVEMDKLRCSPHLSLQ